MEKVLEQTIQRDTGWLVNVFNVVYLRYFRDSIFFNEKNIKTLNSKTWGQTWRKGTKCDCKRKWLWVQSPREEMKYLLEFLFLHFGVKAKRDVEFRHLMPSEFGGMWGKHYRNTRLPLPTLLCAGYSVKLKLNIIWARTCVLRLSSRSKRRNKQFQVFCIKTIFILNSNISPKSIK